MVLIKKCVKFEDLEIKKVEETQETQKTEETQEAEETQETQDLGNLDLQNLNEKEVKTLSKHIFKHLFNSSLHLAAYILSQRNEELNKDRLKSLASEIFN